MVRETHWENRLFRISFLALVTSALLLASCSQKQVSQDEPNFSPTPGKTYTAPKVAADQVEHIELDNAYFEYKKWDLKPAAKKSLRQAAEWLKNHPETDAQVEGLCDERGTFEYNIHLGEKRATAARDYLLKLGVPENRLSTVSRGPVPGLQPAKMAHNRRAGFIVYYRK